VPPEVSPAPSRKPRADAERNRGRLLEAARAAFASGGTGASLEDIARSAEVGIGTLYRHFPTREALISEVYRNEAEKLAAAARQLAETAPPLAALRAWLLLFVDYLSTKLILAEALRTMMCDTSELTKASVEQLTASMRLLMDRAEQSGDIAAGETDPLDLLRALSGVAFAGSGPGWEAGARNMVDILISGLRDAGPPTA
jgi:AcrR family transcriptional regulator